jgi:hypothetical protein
MPLRWIPEMGPETTGCEAAGEIEGCDWESSQVPAAQYEKERY